MFYLFKLQSAQIGIYVLGLFLSDLVYLTILFITFFLESHLFLQTFKFAVLHIVNRRGQMDDAALECAQSTLGLGVFNDTGLQVHVRKRGVELDWSEVDKIAANQLLIFGHAQDLEVLANEEENGAEAAGPNGDADAAEDLLHEQRARVVVAVQDPLVLGEEGNGDAAPQPAEAVHRRRLERVVDLQLLHE